MKYNKIVKENDYNKNNFLITCVCSILLLLTLCYFGVNSGTKGTYSATTGATADSITCSSTQYKAYNPSAHAYYCASCPADYSCNGTSKTACPSGQTATAGSGVCKSSSTTTSTCGAGKYYSSAASDCVDCPENHYCPAGDNALYACPGNQISAAKSDSLSDCNDYCPKGKYYNGKGSCSICEAGYYCPSITIYSSSDATIKGREVCPSGQWSQPGTSACSNVSTTACYNSKPSGYECEWNDSALCYWNCKSSGNSDSDDSNDNDNDGNTSSTLTCSKTQYKAYNPSAHAYYCAACPANHSCDGTYKVECPSGQTPIEGAGSCRASSGDSDDMSDITCTPKQYKAYNASAKQFYCAVCPANHSCDGTNKEECSYGYQSVEGAGTCSVICPAGKYYSGGKCHACVANNYCPGDSKMYDCPNNGTSAEGATSKNQCKDGTSDNPSGPSNPDPGDGTGDGDGDSQKVTYKATFDANNGKLEGSSTSTCTANKGESCIIPTLPTAIRNGYAHNGWGTTKSCTSGNTNSVSISSDTTFYACWNKEDNTTDGKGDDGGKNDNINTNPPTGQTITIAIIWFVGLIAICYAFYYFKKVREN